MKHLAFHLAHSRCLINATHQQRCNLTGVIRMNAHKFKKLKKEDGGRSDQGPEIPE